METTREQIARVTSFEDCIVTGCRLEDGHAGPHDYGTGACSECGEPRESEEHDTCYECWEALQLGVQPDDVD